jgi:hypothetical protein
MKWAIGFILACTISGCGDSRNSTIEDCNFEFQIVLDGTNSYKYDSNSGRLQKLIEVDQYSDTTFFLSTESICMLARLCVQNKLMNFPEKFTQDSANKGLFDPSYDLHFTLSGRAKRIIWEKNTTWLVTDEAIRLHSILSKIDSLIVTSPEFRALPASTFILE